MWNGKGNVSLADDGQQEIIVVGIDKDKGSQNALKWTIDNLVTRGQTIILAHVKNKAPPNGSDEVYCKELFLPFRCFCTRKDIFCKDISLEGHDVVKTMIEFVSQNSVEKLIVGSPTRNTFIRKFKSGDTPLSISKGAPDFCTVYVVSKGKVSSLRKAVRSAPKSSPLRSLIETQVPLKPELPNPPLPNRLSGVGAVSYLSRGDKESVRGGRSSRASIIQLSSDMMPETDISFVSSGRPSTERMFPFVYDDFDGCRTSRASNFSDMSFDQLRTPRLSTDMMQQRMSTDTMQMGSEYSGFSQESGSSGWSSHVMEDMETEMRRLKLELKQTMDMYNVACKEALSAKEMAGKLNQMKADEAQKVKDGEPALAMADKENEKYQVAIMEAERAKDAAKREAEKKIKDAEERKKLVESLRAGQQTDIRYRVYTIDEIEEATDKFAVSRKVGEGGYGPVFKCQLDHTSVAVKVLRPDAAQGRSQFNREVEVLSCIRHPNMVLLLGACPEYGCLVYEYMANGSLEDRLLCRGNTPVLPWPLRFRIAADIATGLLFLHQTKPEPLVHRDLKPGNILLDRNFVSKISDVGLARLVPQNVAEKVTQYHMTSTAGTFCYIDPEYQQTGMLGVKSDIYSLGIMLLQIITARPPMGIAGHVGDAIENGKFEEILDPAVKDWPVEEALAFAKIAVQCSELRRKDRPDLATGVLPVLERLRDLADEHMYQGMFGGSCNPSPVHSYVSVGKV